MTRLIPSFPRVAIRIGGKILAVCVLAFFSLDYPHGRGSHVSAAVFFPIPIVLFPVAIWFGFVPRVLEYSEAQITLSTLVGTCTYPWGQLFCYGWGRGVFKIQFSDGRQPYRIYSGAYAKAEWARFVEQMKTRFPEREADGFSIGPGTRPKEK
jgi:hypothetical protein